MEAKGIEMLTKAVDKGSNGASRNIFQEDVQVLFSPGGTLPRQQTARSTYGGRKARKAKMPLVLKCKRLDR